MGIKLTCEKCGTEEKLENLLNENPAPKIIIDRCHYPYILRGKCMVCGNIICVVTKERD